MRGATKKKRKSGIGLPRAVVYFDLQRLFYRFSCSKICLLYTSPSPRDISGSRMPSYG
ncbi:hypothetical protein ACX3V1_04240 [Escherichia coli]